MTEIGVFNPTLNGENRPTLTGLNDLTMIEYAGIGVAMDNAQPVLKEKSDFVTLSNDQDGVAEAVKHFWKEIA